MRFVEYESVWHNPVVILINFITRILQNVSQYAHDSVHSHSLSSWKFTISFHSRHVRSNKTLNCKRPLQHCREDPAHSCKLYLVPLNHCLPDYPHLLPARCIFTNKVIFRQSLAQLMSKHCKNTLTLNVFTWKTSQSNNKIICIISAELNENYLL